ncbi:MAG: putative transcriptional regulator [Candidatus Bathyarchaeota archaeon B23]|nr:MAG: putative transcriptional regulator [Candidatus Bathyarchaeota archaeon B23]
MRRNGLDICADILEVARMGARKTHIVYKANLNFRIVERYLQRLMEGGLLERRKGERLYVTTPEGLRFLERYRELTNPLYGGGRP